ncbi:hypothetical protein [Tsuneonella sp. SYSU-LHT278]|uniref:hypothetical protein n=1 Tax=Tsuneonella sediminis TaxID=3416089 RepID=UPI003F7A6D5B
MSSSAVSRAGKLLLVPAIIAMLAGCDSPAEQAAGDPPAAEEITAVPAPETAAASTETETAMPAAPSTAASARPAAAPDPAATKAAAPRAAAKPSPAATAAPATDPHAGHDMSTMSEKDMKKMGH